MTFCQGVYVPITILIRAELRSLHTANLQILLTSTKIWVLRSINRPYVTMADHFAFSHPNAHSLKRFIDFVHVLRLGNLTNRYGINIWQFEARNLFKQNVKIRFTRDSDAVRLCQGERIILFRAVLVSTYTVRIVAKPLSRTTPVDRASSFV